MMRRLSIAAAFLLLAARATAAPVVMTGKVIHVADGDTLTVLDGQNIKHKIRLEGIDAPEHKQAFGSKSRLALVALALEKQASVSVIGQDRYGRELGRVTVDGVDINLRLVHDGMAWHFVKYAPNDKALAAAESEARLAKRGLWADAHPVAPWDWRKSEADKRKSR